MDFPLGLSSVSVGDRSGSQTGQSRIIPFCLSSPAPVIWAECWFGVVLMAKAGMSLERTVSRRYILLHICTCLSALMVPSQMCELPIQSAPTPIHKRNWCFDPTAFPVGLIKHDGCVFPKSIWNVYTGAENMLPLCYCPSQMRLDLKKSVAFLQF